MIFKLLRYILIRIFSTINFTKGLAFYVYSYILYINKTSNPNFSLSIKDSYPCLTDRFSHSHLEPIYILQDAWASKLIFKLNPVRHYDIGSSVLMLSILAQKIPTTMIDIRPINIVIPGLDFQKGSILALPFDNGSIISLSSICVLEHIGLGRYGDKIDVFGTEKSIKEISRVMKRNGDLIISVPVDWSSVIHFNAHRTFTRELIMSLFKEFRLIEERYIYGKDVFSSYDKSKGFGTGLYHFKKK